MIYLYSFDIKPLGLNNLYPSSKSGRRFLSKTGKQYKNFISLSAKVQNPKLTIAVGCVIKATYVFCLPSVITKKGLHNKNSSDVDGLCKAVNDAIFEVYGIDDSIVYRMDAIKVYQENPKIMAKLEIVPLENFFNPLTFLY